MWPSVGDSGPLPNSWRVKLRSACVWRARLSACARIHGPSCGWVALVPGFRAPLLSDSGGAAKAGALVLIAGMVADAVIRLVPNDRRLDRSVPLGAPLPLLAQQLPP